MILDIHTDNDNLLPVMNYKSFFEFSNEDEMFASESVNLAVEGMFGKILTFIKNFFSKLLEWLVKVFTIFSAKIKDYKNWIEKEWDPTKIHSEYSTEVTRSMFTTKPKLVAALATPILKMLSALLHDGTPKGKWEEIKASLKDLANNQIKKQLEDKLDVFKIVSSSEGKPLPVDKKDIINIVEGSKSTLGAISELNNLSDNLKKSKAYFDGLHVDKITNSKERASVQARLQYVIFCQGKLNLVMSGLLSIQNTSVSIGNKAMNVK
jgi:polynucleotide 5'-kinase involved in rRNA processing